MIGTVEKNYDFCVIGGGMAGLCAAVAAARGGAKTALMQERPVLGGNASSEIRMWVCGAQGRGNRETGIIEEINLENLWRNPDKVYAIWDGILYGKAREQENLDLYLNCSCNAAEMDGNRIVSVTGWQMTTQKNIKIKAKQFADCSGDSILAPLTGAEFRRGRESADEFGEDTSVKTPDTMTMGMSCLIQGRKGTVPVKFIPPAWADKLTDEDFAARDPNPEYESQNYWYLELGGDRDEIGDTEEVRDQLLALAYGTWDYVKNSGRFPDADLWELEFVGFLPGKRESRRMVGDHILTQREITDNVIFDDTVAFGGWPLDDHFPGGFRFSGPPNTSIQSVSPYCIPYRCLYSKNIENLFFAGRNISTSHTAFSSTRVMATCAVCGQATGSAAALAVKYGIDPKAVGKEHIRELQNILMRDDCFLPYRKREISGKCVSAALLVNGDPDPEAEVLRNGIGRDNFTYGEEKQGYEAEAGAEITYRLEKPTDISEIRIVFDSDLDRDTLPGGHVEKTRPMRANRRPDSPRMHLPLCLTKEYTVRVTLADGSEKIASAEKNNIRRLVRIPLNEKVIAVTLVPEAAWGEGRPRIMEFDFE